MKTKQWLFAALTVLLLAGCSNESDLTRTDDVNPSIPEGMTQLNFEIKGVRTGTSYVALTQEEAQLKDLFVLLFPQSADGPKPDAVSVAVLKAKVTTKDGAYKAAVLMDKTILAGKYYAVLLANMNALLGVTPPDLDERLASLEGMTYTEIFNDLTANERDGNMLPVATYGLAMKALVKDINLTEADRGDVIPLRATMTRPQARFDIKNTAYKSFTITGYTRKNVHENTRLYFLDSDVPSFNSVIDYTPVALTEAQKTLLNTPSFDDDNNPGTPLVMAYNPAFYCYPGQAADQSYVEITGELKVSSGGTRTVTYTIPLKTNTPDAYIAIQSNKRYKIELRMTESEQLVGDLTMDAGSWDDEGAGTGNDNIEEQLPGEVTAVKGATYDAATKTFNVAENINTFSFTFIVSTNLLQKAATDPGIVDKIEEATTLVAPNTKYTVTLAATGTSGSIEEMGKGKDGLPVVVNTYKVKRAGGAPIPPADVNGHKSVLIDDLWFVDPSPVGQNDTTEPCPEGWTVPTLAQICRIMSNPPLIVTGPSNQDSGPDLTYTMNKNLDFVAKVGNQFNIDGSALAGFDYITWCVRINNGTEVYIGHELAGCTRCVREAN